MAVTAASVGIIYGYDLSNIAGALLFITDEFGLTTRQQELVTTAVVIGEIAGAIVGCMLANVLDRKKSMVLVAATYAAFALMSALSVSVPMLLVSRLLLGLTIGVSVVWSRCTSPSWRRRGSAARCWSPTRWRPSSASSSVTWPPTCWPAPAAGGGCWAWPRSPRCWSCWMLRMPDTARWYMLKGRATRPARRCSR